MKKASTLRDICFPHTIVHVIHLRKIGRAVKIFLQMIEVAGKLKTFIFIQDGTSIPFIYFFRKIVIHSTSPKRDLQHDLAARACANHFKFHNPHPLLSFGSAIFCQLARWKSFCFLAPLQIKFVINCFIWCKEVKGILTKMSQYTRIIYSTVFSRTTLPPREIQRKDHQPILFSIFLIN